MRRGEAAPNRAAAAMAVRAAGGIQPCQAALDLHAIFNRRTRQDLPARRHVEGMRGRFGVALEIRAAEQGRDFFGLRGAVQVLERGAKARG